jgi:predicted GIY-YIG superfamily endonuclease
VTTSIARALAEALANRTPPPAVRTALYRLYDASDELLYIGITANPKSRWQHHKSQQPWWPRVATKKIEWHPTRAEAEHAEAMAIRTELPEFNIAHHPALEAEHEDRVALRRLQWLVRRTAVAAAGGSTTIGDLSHGLPDAETTPRAGHNDLLGVHDRADGWPA